MPLGLPIRASELELVAQALAEPLALQRAVVARWRRDAAGLRTLLPDPPATAPRKEESSHG